MVLAGHLFVNHEASGKWLRRELTPQTLKRYVQGGGIGGTSMTCAQHNLLRKALAAPDLMFEDALEPGQDGDWFDSRRCM